MRTGGYWGLSFDDIEYSDASHYPSKWDIHTDHYVLNHSVNVIKLFNTQADDDAADRLPNGDNPISNGHNVQAAMLDADVDAAEHDVESSNPGSEDDDSEDGDSEDGDSEDSDFEDIGAVQPRSSGIAEFMLSPDFKRYEMPKGMEEVMFLARLYGTLKRFIRDFESFTYTVSQGALPSVSNLSSTFKRRRDGKVPPPTAEELVRLQRGFLRYELCCRLYGMPGIIENTNPKYQPPIFGDQPRSKPTSYFTQFIRRLKHWEREEVYSVVMYVSRQYELTIRDMQDDLQESLTLRQISRDVLPDNPGSEKACFAGDLLDKDGRLRHLTMGFAITRGVGSWIQCVTGLGLSFLQRFLRSSPASRQMLFKHTYQYFRGYGLPNKIFHQDSCWARDGAYSHGRNPCFGWALDRLWIFPNLRYLGYHGGGVATDETLDIDRLRDVGWVFWEEEHRCESMKLTSGHISRSSLWALGGGEQVQFVLEECELRATELLVKLEDFENLIVPKFSVELGPVDRRDRSLMSEESWVDPDEDETLDEELRVWSAECCAEVAALVGKVNTIASGYSLN